MKVGSSITVNPNATRYFKIPQSERNLVRESLPHKYIEERNLSRGEDGRTWPKINAGENVNIGQVLSAIEMPVSIGDSKQTITVLETRSHIQVRIISVETGERVSTVTLRRLNKDIFAFDNDKAFVFAVPGYTLESVGFGIWIAFVTATVLSSKLAAKSRSRAHSRFSDELQPQQFAEPEVGTRRPSPYEKQEGVPRRPANPPYNKYCSDELSNLKNISVDHDLECSDPGSNWLGLGACGLRVNVSHCCRDHDIDMWCVPSLNALLAAGYCTSLSLKLSTCILNTCFEAIHNQEGFLCRLANIIIAPVAAVVWAAVYGVATDAICIAMIATGAPQYPSSDGRNRDSCLCGGTVPTIAGSACKDLCAERGIKADCFDCHWRCQYDREGKPIGRIYVTDRNGSKGCCPGSSRQCTGDCNPLDFSKCPPAPQDTL